MTTKTVLYFLAGAQATADELSDIAKLNAAAVAQYEVKVLNGAENSKYGEPDRLVPSDYAAGTIPTIYEDVPVIDPDNIPNQALTATQAIVNDGDTFDVTGGTVSVTVANGVPTFAFTAE